MRELFQEKKGPFLLLLGSLYLLFIILYFFFHLPLAQELDAKENQIIQTENDVKLLEVEIAQLEDGESENERSNIQIKNAMPQSREVDNLILALQEIELVSGVQVNSIRFSYDGTLPEPVPMENEEGTEESNQEQDEREEKTPVINLDEMPENLRTINISLEVTSPDYEHFQKFITEIEKQERVMMVSYLTFTKPAERELITGEDGNETIPSSVDITTFYYTD